MISQSCAQKALDVALSRGGDYAELFLEDTASNSLSMQSGESDGASSSRRCGCGIRVLDGSRYIYTYTAGLNENDIIAAAQAAADALAQDRQAQAVRFEVRSFGAYPLKAAEDIDNAYRAKLLIDACRAGSGVDPRISQVKASVADVDQRVLICSSEGLFTTDRRVRTRIRVQAVASEGGDMQTGFMAPGSGCGYELFDRIDPAELGKQAAQSALMMLSAPECPAGFFPVVVENGFGGVIFHEACGHSLETSAVAYGNSEFCGKIGQQIASPCVSAVDDGTMDGEWGSCAVDDEGTETKRNLLIENGILKSYMSDIIGSRRMGIALTGNGRRQDYTFAPTSRMTNTFIAPGKDNRDEMIATMGDGLYAIKMGGGSVNPLTGEFNFAVNEAYWVKNGKIHTPVRGASLIGKGGKVLMDIDRVSDNLELAAGVCGSSSGSVPTNVGQPCIRIKGITVGGKGEML